VTGFASLGRLKAKKREKHKSVVELIILKHKTRENSDPAKHSGLNTTRGEKEDKSAKSLQPRTAPGGAEGKTGIQKASGGTYKVRCHLVHTDIGRDVRPLDSIAEG